MDRWTPRHSWRGGADREQVRQLETGTTAIHHGLVFPFLLGQRSTLPAMVGCFFMNKRLDNCPVSRYNDYVVYEKELKLMTNTESNYVYTLDDVYRIFQQAANGERLGLLREWQAMNLPYLINWDKIIQRNVI
jgi:hypothetical protein